MQLCNRETKPCEQGEGQQAYCCRHYLEVLGDRDAEADAGGIEVAGEQQLPELLVEGAQVGHKAAGQMKVCGYSIKTEVLVGHLTAFVVGGHLTAMFIALG